MVSIEPDGMTVDLLLGQTEVLEGIATGHPLEKTLAELARLAEGQLPGSRCRFLPPEAETDESWSDAREAARQHPPQTGWSFPVVNTAGNVLGTLAVCHPQPNAPPTPGDAEKARLIIHLAVVAIERSRERKRLAANEEKWRRLFEHSTDAILLIDDARRFVEVNAVACETFGAPSANILGQDVNVFMHPLPRPDLPDKATRWATFLQEGYAELECTVHRPDGTVRHAALRARANFQPGLHFYVLRDVTEQRLAEEGLRRTEQLYRSLIETTGTGYLVADEAGRVLDANSEYVHLTGWPSLSAILGRSPLEWVAPHDRERFAAAMRRCLERGTLRDLEIDFLHPRGHVVPVEVNTTAVQTDEGVRLLTLCHDISGRLQTRRELQNASRELEARVERRTAELARASEQIRARARQQEAVAELGRCALAGMPIDALIQRAVDSVVSVLGVEFSAVLEHADPEGDQLILRANSGWETEELGQPLATTDPSGLAGFALHQTEPVIYENLPEETRFRPPRKLVDGGIFSGITVQIPGDAQPFGLISGQTVRRRHFTLDDAFFLQALANVLAVAIERRRTEDTVRLAQQSAVQANNAKIEFLSRMSHELRTPLNAILGFSQLLELERLDPGQSESVEQITRAGRHLLELVNEVLDISRIDSGHIALTPEPLALDALLREALDLIRPLADARGVQLIAGPGCTEANRYVLADRQRLRQVLLNLLSNAVKYNREAGSVTLDGGPAPDGRYVRLTVSDTGVGIRAEDLSRLYTPFDRLGAENTNVEGSGMGLALSKRLVETQGGQLEMESEWGVGSTFRVDLPVAAAPKLDDVPLLDEFLRQTLFQDDESVSGLTHTEPQPMPPTLPLPSPPTVLHIEDNEPNRLLVEMLVARRPGVRLFTASRGKEGLDLAREHHPNLILLDLHLPDTTGEEVLHDLRADESMHDTPVVMVSADATAIRRSQAYTSGASDFLTKPFNVGQFLKMLDQYLK